MLLSDVKKGFIPNEYICYVCSSCCYLVLHYTYIFLLIENVFFACSHLKNKKTALHSSNQTTHPLTPLTRLRVIKHSKDEATTTDYESEELQLELSMLLPEKRTEIEHRNSQAVSSQALIGIGFKMKTLKELNRFRFVRNPHSHSFIYSLNFECNISIDFLSNFFFYFFHFVWAIIGMNYISVFVSLLSVLVGVV